MSTDANLLAEVPLFQLLDEEERTSLAAHLNVVKHPAGHVIFNYGEPGDSMYVIRSGGAEMSSSRTTRVRRSSWKTSARGDFFGELAFLDGGSRSATVLVSAEMEALVMDRSDLDQFLRSHPAAALDLLTALGRRLRKTSELLRHTATRNVNEETEDRRSTVQKTADWIAEFSGSIPFLLLHGGFFAVWIGWNMLAPDRIAFRSLPVRLLDDGRLAGSDFPLRLRAPQPEPAGGQGPGARGHRIRSQFARRTGGGGTPPENRSAECGCARAP